MLRSTEPVLQLFFEVLRVHKFTLELDRMYLRNKYDIKKKKMLIKGLISLGTPKNIINLSDTTGRGR